MASIDYGAVVFKNGKRYEPEKLFPYIEELKLEFYKTDVYYYGGPSTDCFTEAVTAANDKFHQIFKFDDKILNIKKIDDGIFKCHINYNDDKYDIVFGYGIDNNVATWNRCKVKYLGKKLSKKIDKILNKCEYFD